MTRFHSRTRIGIAALLAVGAVQLTTATRAAADATPTRDSGTTGTPARPTVDVPKAVRELTPGPGFRPLAAYAVQSGTQTYTCGADGAWPSASTPQATLVRLPGGGDTVEHFAGPRWRAGDGSTIVGTVRTRVPEGGQLPWLLLDVTAHEGPQGALTPVTHVNRVLTSGGLPPSGTCTPGTTVSPAYQAVYVFWMAVPPNG